LNRRRGGYGPVLREAGPFLFILKSVDLFLKIFYNI
jgi:hypothetical protein